MSGVNDRGSIKWTAMMMTEHIEMLKSLIFWNKLQMVSPNKTCENNDRS